MFELQGSSPVNHDFSEDATSSRDISQEADANADFKEVESEEKMETPETQTDPAKSVKQEAMDHEMQPRPYSNACREASLHLQLDNGDQEDSNAHSQNQDLDLGFVTGDKVDGAKVYQLDPDEQKTRGVSFNFLLHKCMLAIK